VDQQMEQEFANEKTGQRDKEEQLSHFTSAV